MQMTVTGQSRDRQPRQAPQGIPDSELSRASFRVLLVLMVLLGGGIFSIEVFEFPSPRSDSFWTVVAVSLGIAAVAWVIGMGLAIVALFQKDRDSTLSLGAMALGVLIVLLVWWAVVRADRKVMSYEIERPSPRPPPASRIERKPSATPRRTPARTPRKPTPAPERPGLPAELPP